jgi:two-component system chemotaxis sensor kinase CheA
MANGDDDFISGFMNDYFEESDEHLGTVRGILLSLESLDGVQQIAPSTLDEMFRIFHSIKGISGMVQLRDAEMLAHEMESYLRALRRREAILTPAGVDALVAGVDTLERVIVARRENRAAPPISSAIAEIAAVMPGGTSATGPTDVVVPPSGQQPDAEWVVTFVPSAALSERGLNVDSVRARLRSHGTILQAAPKILPGGVAFEFGFTGELDDATRETWASDGMTVARAQATLPPPDAPADPQDLDADATAGGVAPAPAAASHYVRVDLARLDDLMRMIGDLVISRARLSDTLARVERRVPAIEWREVHENSALIERQLRDLREGVVRIRLVPVGEIFRRMPFVVRDLAKQSGAKVRLVLEGQETEIDKYLIERMMDPILHIVRNSVSHAFEAPSERLAAGKPEEGTLRLSASTAGESVVLEIADDGRGIDAESVARRARAAGMTVPEEPLDSAALLELICAPGFSTRDETDRGSGRGIGMAVVKSTIQQLSGALSLDTETGRGTSFTIELPLTLSITEAMIAVVGDRTFAVPQGSVREVIELDPTSLRAIEANEIAPYRGGVLPVLRLSRLFGIPEHPQRSFHAFVIGSGLEAVGIVVDRITGQREIVVRAFADSLIKVDGIVGATDLGDGRVVLILNLPALARMAQPDPGGVDLAARTRSA